MILSNALVFDTALKLVNESPTKPSGPIDRVKLSLTWGERGIKALGSTSQLWTAAQWAMTADTYM